MELGDTGFVLLGSQSFCLCSVENVCVINVDGNFSLKLKRVLKQLLRTVYTGLFNQLRMQLLLGGRRTESEAKEKKGRLDIVT